jgi:UDP-GlcNAc:undecaprenyl-phosphate GlcNAc-1-phosphate transferase
MSSLLFPFAFFLLPFVISWLLTALLLRWAPRLGLIDHPSARKVHTRPTPKGGGLAIYVAVAGTAALLPGAGGGPLPAVLGLGLAIAGLGLVDDLRPLPWQLRLGVHTVAAGVTVFAWPAEVGWPLRAAGVVWVVGLVNAFNMLDNMDALSAGVAWVAAGVLAGAVLLRHDTVEPAVPFLMLMGALAGFLWFNRPPARIFMGDAGSTFLGFYLGVLSLGGEVVDPAVGRTWAVPVCVLAVPCYDLTSVVLLRLCQGRSPFHADKQHLSHRLVQLGLSSPAAVGVIYLLALGSGLAGLLLYHVPDGAAALVVLQLACWWAAVAAVEFLARREGKYQRTEDRGQRTEDG